MIHPISDHESARRDQLSEIIGPPFELKSVLGTGGQAEVWLARDAELDRSVAMKVLRPDASNRPDLVARMRREAVTIARIQSPHVVPILQFIARGDTCVLVMPFVEGETLAAALSRRGHLPLPEAMRLVRETALGLADAHALGVVHRDVKPSNILIDAKTGSARLTDFGIAKAIGAGEPSLTATGAVVGSAQYMSPEQFDTSSAVGTPSDVYALGVVAFEVITGGLPFTGKTVGQLALQHSTELPPSLLAFDSVPEPLATLVDRCLAKNPGERPTARELAENLEATGAAEVETAARGPRSLRIVRFVSFLLATIVLSLFTLFFKGESLIMLKGLLKALLKAALHML